MFMAGCATTGSPAARLGAAVDRAAAAGMTRHSIAAAPFILTSFEHIGAPGATQATIYIEGDGLAWTGRRTPSLDPTPPNPVALDLAIRQGGAGNVIYLARPCQFTRMVNPETPCPMKYWTSHRFAPEVIWAMNAALDNIRYRYDIDRFDLVGFSGGAAVAAILAAERSDISSLRTVAGNLDHEAVNRIHDVSRMPHSLNPRDIAPKLKTLPQIHFVGRRDSIITNEVTQSFIDVMGPDTCARTVWVDATHEDGWAEAWPALFAERPACPIE